MDDELLRMIAAYEHIKGMSRAQWMRALEYISKRMAEDDRAAHAATETMPPTWWTIAGYPGEFFPSKEEAIEECFDYTKVIEVNGVAVVSQQFCVLIPIGDDEGHIEDYERKWFDTRETAEKYLSDMSGVAGAAEPIDPGAG